MSRTLSHRVGRLEARIGSTRVPFKIEIEFIASDGSVTGRLLMGGGDAANDHGRVGAGMPVLPRKPVPIEK